MNGTVKADLHNERSAPRNPSVASDLELPSRGLRQSLRGDIIHRGSEDSEAVRLLQGVVGNQAVQRLMQRNGDATRLARLSDHGSGTVHIQRTPATAAQELFEQGFKEVKKSAIKGPFAKKHAVTAADIAAIQAALDGLRAAAGPAAVPVANDSIGATITFDGTDYTDKAPFIQMLKENYGVSEDATNTALGRMIKAGKQNKDLKRSGPFIKGDAELQKLKEALHESFGIGDNGCTFFFVREGDAITVIAVGNHVRDSKHYSLVYGAKGYPAKGNFEFP